MIDTFDAVRVCRGQKRYATEDAARAGFGMEIATKPIEYATGRDDDAQRASLLELV